MLWAKLTCNGPMSDLEFINFGSKSILSNCGLDWVMLISNRNRPQVGLEGIVCIIELRNMIYIIL